MADKHQPFEKLSTQQERLRADLDAHAVALGYPDEIPNLPSGLNPDVLRHCPATNVLFVGVLIKTTENEFPVETETIQRFLGFLGEYFHLVENSDIDGGIIAFATDNSSAATEWPIILETLFCRSFTASKIEDKDTWVISCRGEG